MEIEGESPKHVTLDIMHEDALLSSIKQKMEHISLSNCVCKVPEELYKGNEEKYFPTTLSIGPLHHTTTNHTLMPMEDQKWRYLNALIARAPNSEATLDTCIKSLRQVEQKARKFYGQPIPMGGDCLVELLLLDSCFIIQLFLNYAYKSLRRRDDPCFTSTDSLSHLRQHYLPTHSTHAVTLPNIGHTYIPQASRLVSLGIRVERAATDNISFFNGRLSIPPLEIHSYTEVLFRNLIAMEHCSNGCSKHVTSYVVLLEGLIRSERDVRVVQEREILINGHEREREIVFLLQRLHVDVTRDEFYYRGLCEEISKHQRRRRDVCWVRMSEFYHRSQFGIAGFSLAVVLLVFIFTGAFFSTVYFLLHHFQ
ncbi:hypothetical protein SASPL_109459 [Salvia splendens]|uniref:Uncharacterized protein n=1 Tax=Salvia splendens TaxID=180675 RepID=A0A8X8YGD4_SALSN|nr:hypothetical protein SASPL_109459 [Salvia splendens]